MRMQKGSNNYLSTGNWYFYNVNTAKIFRAAHNFTIHSSDKSEMIKFETSAKDKKRILSISHSHICTYIFYLNLVWCKEFMKQGNSRQGNFGLSSPSKLIHDLTCYNKITTGKPSQQLNESVLYILLLPFWYTTKLPMLV